MLPRKQWALNQRQLSIRFARKLHMIRIPHLSGRSGRIIWRHFDTPSDECCEGGLRSVTRNATRKISRTKSKQKNKKSLRRLGRGLFFPAFLDGEGSGAAGRSLRGVNCVTLR